MTRSLARRGRLLEVSRQNLYFGKSGQLAVMAEFLIRGYNVAVPEVDVGEDIFVVRDKDGELSRIQVKTGNANELQSGGFRVTFKVPLRQLEMPHTLHGVGSEHDGDVVIHLAFSESDVLCKKQSVQSYRNQWSKWPSIDHKSSPVSDVLEDPSDVG